jgi:hypothetical protein
MARDRSPVVDVSSKFLDILDARIAQDDRARTFDDLAARLGVGRGTAERLKKRGKITKQTLARACAVYGLDYPIICADTPRDVMWCQLGMELREVAPEQFEAILDEVRAIVEGERVKRRRRR